MDGTTYKIYLALWGFDYENYDAIGEALQANCNLIDGDDDEMELFPDNVDEICALDDSHCTTFSGEYYLESSTSLEVLSIKIAKLCKKHNKNKAFGFKMYAEPIPVNGKTFYMPKSEVEKLD